ncbi:hypothetical protein GGF31_002763 [Allomyces arbusculus]|nr:hypothetical protein GGF31_002763 [Allomyces arbusculus]
MLSRLAALSVRPVRPALATAASRAQSTAAPAAPSTDDAAAPRRLATDPEALPLAGTFKDYKMGSMYTAKDLDETEPFIRNPTELSRARVDVFKAMGTEPASHYKDYELLAHFVTETGMIMHRKHSKLTAKNHRKLTKVIKRARAMGLMPYTYRPDLVKIGKTETMNFDHM